MNITYRPLSSDEKTTKKCPQMCRVCEHGQEDCYANIAVWGSFACFQWITNQSKWDPKPSVYIPSGYRIENLNCLFSLLFTLWEWSCFPGKSGHTLVRNSPTWNEKATAHKGVDYELKTDVFSRKEDSKILINEMQSFTAQWRQQPQQHLQFINITLRWFRRPQRSKMCENTSEVINLNIKMH